jgi:hypothetical protein
VKAFSGIPPCAITSRTAAQLFSFTRVGDPENAFTCLHLSRFLSDFVELRVKAREKNAFTCLHRETVK